MRFWIASWFAVSMLLVGAASTWGAPHTNTIPFTKVLGDDDIPHLLVQATINSHPVLLIFDTGADFNAAESKTIKGCDVIGQTKEAGAAGTRVVPVVLTTVIIGIDTFRRVPVETLDTAALSDNLHVRIDGLLGEDVISQYKRVTIDFEAKTITLEN